VVATSINPIDWKIIEGHVQSFFKVKLPGIRGLDVSGTVAEIGSAVTRFKVGDAVYGKTGALDGGCLAEFVSVPENKLVHKSEKITFEEAASIPLVALTSYQSLKKAGLKSGQHVLILGGSGGTGSIGIQIAKKMGAHVTTTTSNFDFVKKLGADVVVDYTKDDWVSNLKENSFDVIYDSIGGHYSKTAKLAKPNGQFVAIMGPGPKEGEPGPTYNYILTQDILQDLEEINNWINEGALKPIVDTVYKFDDLFKAFEHSIKGRTKGKIVVKF